jgi:site-specific DNA-methyltransferase (adenine-specific)
MDRHRVVKRRVKHVAQDIAPYKVTSTDSKELELVLSTRLGTLYRGDCMELFRALDHESVDLVFADPPFNLNKKYKSQINDNVAEHEYLAWMRAWLLECARVLRPGGSFFLWNLPRWNYRAASMLDGLLSFRHWISVDIKYTLPIPGRLYPSHYSLLYFCKGKKPSVFHPDRLPMPVCPSCFADLRDYGGYKDRMNPKGVNLPDVWTDIPPVRHAKYKRREGVNELSIKLLDRVIELASNEGDLVLDPFGGAGTTYVVCELKARKWIGIELGPVDDILARFKNIDADREYLDKLRAGYNHLFLPRVAAERKKRGLWTSDSVRKDSVQQLTAELDFGEVSGDRH